MSPGMPAAAGARFEEGDDRKSIVLPPFRLDFAWLGDRWTHELRAGDGASWRSLARAVEGDAGRDDPARVVSPAYQQLHLQRDDALSRALLVGQSGPHHFSAAFTVREEAGAIVVEADVADRCRSEVAALACTYVVEATSGDLLDADAALANWSIPALGRLAFEVVAPGSLALAEGGRRGTQVQAGARIEPDAQTHRCQYLWRWTPARL